MTGHGSPAPGIPNAATSNYPQFGSAVASRVPTESPTTSCGGSTGVGSIGYVETGFAVQRGFPVVAVKNASGNFALPSAANVAIALTKATLNSDNTQNLEGVYANTNKALVSHFVVLLHDHADDWIEP